MKITSKPLHPWVIVLKEGTIAMAYCNGMEACTHVGTLIFAIDTAVRIWEAKTVTEEKAYWLLLLLWKKYRMLQSRTSTSALQKQKKKRLDECIRSCTSATEDAQVAVASSLESVTPTAKRTADISPPTDAELDELFLKLNVCTKNIAYFLKLHLTGILLFHNPCNHAF